MPSYITTQTQKDAVTEAPAVQLVWRPSDKGLTPPIEPVTATASVPSEAPAGPLSNDPPLPVGAIAGIAVGGVVSVVVLVLSLLLYLRGRRRRRDGTLDGGTGETTKPTDTVEVADTPGGTVALEAGEKPELDATPAAPNDAVSMAKQELPGESKPQAFELDASPPVPELEGKQDIPASSAGRPAANFRYYCLRARGPSSCFSHH